MVKVSAYRHLLDAGLDVFCHLLHAHCFDSAFTPDICRHKDVIDVALFVNMGNGNLELALKVTFLSLSLSLSPNLAQSKYVSSRVCVSAYACARFYVCMRARA